MSEDRAEDSSAKANAADADGTRGDTRRQFVERLAKTAAVPLVVPLMLSMSSAAFAY